MSNALIEFWREPSFSELPFTHPADQKLLGGLAEIRSSDFDSFIRSPCFDYRKSVAFHSGLLPVPFEGDLTTAKVFLLMLNPGFDPSDYRAEEDGSFRETRLATLRQELAGHDFPFRSLNPGFAWTSGFRYWFGKFREIISSLAERRFDGEFLPTLRLLAGNVCVLQAFPYHSERFGAKAVARQLPSFEIARAFVAELFLRAQHGEVLVIMLRGASLWPTPPKEVLVLRGPFARGANLGLKTEVGLAVHDWLLRS